MKWIADLWGFMSHSDAHLNAQSPRAESKKPSFIAGLKEQAGASLALILRNSINNFTAWENFLISTVTQPKIGDFFTKLVSIVSFRIAPVVLTYYLKESAEEYLATYDEILPSETQALIYLLLNGSAACVYAKTATVGFAQMGFLTLDTKDIIPQKVLEMADKATRDYGDPALSNIKTTMHSFLGYGISWLLIKGIGFIPVIGRIEQLLLISHNGTYILSLAMPLRYDISLPYKREYWELSAAFGINSYILSSCLNYYLSEMEGFPGFYTREMLNLSVLLLQVGLAAHMELPKPIQASKRALVFPITLLEIAADHMIIFLMKMQHRLPHFIKKRPAIPLPDMSDTLISFFESSFIEACKRKVMPLIFMDLEALRKDSIIGPKKDMFITSTTQNLKQVMDAESSWSIWLASFVPNTTATGVQITLGLPPFATILFLKIVYSKPMTYIIRSVFRFIEEQAEVHNAVPLLEGSGHLIPAPKPISKSSSITNSPYTLFNSTRLKIIATKPLPAESLTLSASQ